MRTARFLAALLAFAVCVLWLLRRFEPPSLPPEAPPEPRTPVPEAENAPVEIRPPAAPKPDGPWRAEFEAAWKDKGRRIAQMRPWMLKKTIIVLADDDMSREYLEVDRKLVLQGLEETGARRFQVVVEDRFPPEFKACIRGHLLDWNCLGKAVQELRATQPLYSGCMVYFRTHATMDMEEHRGNKPFTIQGVRKSPPVRTVPPGGLTSQSDGFAVVSDFMSRYVGAYAGPGGKPYPEETERRWRLRSAPYDDRVAHEVFHLLGMPHHPDIKNPGFEEARLCTDCHENRPSHAGRPHPECTMVCAGNDQPAHRRKHGKNFGLCPTCLAAARSLVTGIEGR